VEHLSHALTNKFMHGPTAALNEGDGERRVAAAELIARIYHLNQGE
ncbi:MAG: glutamyl-tRNA reductase, partial [Rhodocyclaceae bacterium]|nr:glutamyl-tRNA reductase [Rhodocyclaceae bacterium]